MIFMYANEKDKSKKITLIMSGGTISSDYDGRIMRPGMVTAFDELSGRVSDVKTPFCMLSENMTWKTLHMLGDCLDEAIKTSKAVIITHGTDTLAYTASYLGLRNAGIDIPVMIVSADFPLSNPMSNGSANLMCALAAIDYGVKGVFVPYRNPYERPVLHVSTRLLSSRDFDGGLNSALGKVCGYTDRTGKFMLQEEIRPREFKLCGKGGNKAVRLVFANPGIDYAALAESARKENSALVFAGYHTGTINTGAEGIGLLDGIETYLAGGLHGEKYQSVEQMPSFVNVIDNIAPITLYTKVRIAHENFASERERLDYIHADTFGEYF